MVLGHKADVTGAQNAFAFDVKLALFHDVEGVRAVGVLLEPGVGWKGIFENGGLTRNDSHMDFALDVLVLGNDRVDIRGVLRPEIQLFSHLSTLGKSGG